MAIEGYQAAGTYSDSALSAADKAKVSAYKQQWETAFYNNDRAGMDAAHAGAEAIRAQYGYSGGADGSGYYALGWSVGAQPQYTNSVIREPVMGTSYIDDYYSAAQEAALAAYRAAYDQNVLRLDAQKSTIEPYYQTARNETGTHSELSRAAFNEAAAAKGLNSGAGGQASLAMSNTLQSNLSGLSRAEANAFADIELERAKLETAYHNDIAQAIANGSLAKAQTLYNEYVRYDTAMASAAQAQANEDYRSWGARTETYNTNYNNQLRSAQILAQFGDFSGYELLGFTAEQILMMQQAYAALAAQ